MHRVRIIAVFHEGRREITVLSNQTDIVDSPLPIRNARRDRRPRSAPLLLLLILLATATFSLGWAWNSPNDAERPAERTVVEARDDEDLAKQLTSILI
jgi:hypothetical protein